MPTLLKFWVGEKLIQCDNRCYGAKKGACVHCACRGENHGIGFAAAKLKTRAFAPQWAKERKGLTRWTVAASLTVGHRDEWNSFPLFEAPPLTKWVKKHEDA